MDELRHCRHCKMVKPLSEFYKSDERACKPCVRAKVRANRAAKVDYYREFDRKRAMLPHRVQARAEYLKTERGREAYNRAHEASLKRYPERKAAAVAVGNAVKAGRIQKHPCFICGSEKVQGHHPNYDAPLDVIWLCVPHHRAAHKAAKEQM